MRQLLSGARIFTVTLALLVVLGASLAWSQRAASRQDTQYEYWLVEVDVSMGTFPSRIVQERLNALGKGGWQLVETRDAIGKEGALWLVMMKEAK